MEYFKYTMTEAFAKSILADAKRTKAKGSKQKILCDYVNSQCGIKGECIEVIVA